MSLLCNQGPSCKLWGCRAGAADLMHIVGGSVEECNTYCSLECCFVYVVFQVCLGGPCFASLLVIRSSFSARGRKMRIHQEMMQTSHSAMLLQAQSYDGAWPGKWTRLDASGPLLQQAPCTEGTCARCKRKRGGQLAYQKHSRLNPTLTAHKQQQQQDPPKPTRTPCVRVRA